MNLLQALKRHPLLVRVLCMGAMGLAIQAGCNQKTPTESSQAPAKDAASTAPASTSKKPFVVGYNQWIGLVGVFRAKDKGYFKDAGLDVQLKQFSGPADGVPPVITGQLDGTFTTADTTLLLNKESSENPLKNVYLLDSSDGADGIIAQPGIHSMKDLKGKTVAATLGQCNELLLLKGLQSAGMTESDVKITNMSADTAGAAVMAKKIPAAVTWEPWLTKGKAGGGQVIFSSKETPNIILDVFTVSGKTLKERPDDVKAFLAAVAKGSEEAKQNPSEAAQTAQKYFGTSAAEAKSMLTKVKLYSASENKQLMGTAAAPGPIYESVGEISKFFLSKKMIKEEADPKSLFAPEYLPG